MSPEQAEIDQLVVGAGAAVWEVPLSRQQHLNIVAGHARAPSGWAVRGRCDCDGPVYSLHRTASRRPRPANPNDTGAHR